MEQLSRFLVAGLCFVILLLAPLVAAPLARFLKLGRQALDDKICWEGPRQEEVEDRITYTATFLVSVLAGILAGAVYVWYVQLRFGYPGLAKPPTGQSALDQLLGAGLSKLGGDRLLGSHVLWRVCCGLD